MKNLTDPSRFASFVEGDEHLTLDETIEYDSVLHKMELSDDDEDVDETIDESIAIGENFQRIDKSRTKRYQNGTLNVNQHTPRVTSSTPNGTPRSRQQNISRSRLAKNKSSFEVSDDE